MNKPNTKIRKPSSARLKERRLRRLRVRRKAEVRFVVVRSAVKKFWVATMLEVIDIGKRPNGKPYRTLVGIEITAFTKDAAKRLAKDSKMRLKFEERESTRRFERSTPPLRTKAGRVRTDLCAQEYQRQACPPQARKGR